MHFCPKYVTKQEETEENPSEETDIRYNLSSMEQESVKTLYKQRLDRKLTRTQFVGIDERYGYIKDCLHAAAREALGYYQGSKRGKPYWWDEEIETDIIEKRQQYQKYLTTQSDTDKIKYKETQATVRRKICQKKNEMWNKTCNRLSTYLDGTKNSESWRTINNHIKNNKEEIIATISAQRWDKHFKQLLTEERPEFTEMETNDTIEVIGSPIRITEREIKEVCKILKNNKATGPGDIPNELIKYGTDKLYEHLKILFQECINNAYVPAEWKLSYISPIHKKGGKDICDNYRGLAVTSTISRIYGKILKNRIENDYKDYEAEEQAGFRAGRSTVDHLFCLTQVIEKKVAVNQEVHLVYVDLKKAYDSVPHGKLWESLQSTSVNNNLIKAVKNLYQDTVAKIKIKNVKTEGFHVSKGLRQGCPISPTLFKIYLEQALKTWKNKCKNMGIPLNDNTMYTLNFADDQVILAQDYEDVEYMTRKLIEEYRKWGLDVNTGKTEYMCIGGQQQDLTLEDGQTIKLCSEYKYLGMKISQTGTADEAIREKNMQGRRAISTLNGILWDKQVSKENKKQIYNTIVKSITTYSAEVWPIKVRTEQMLNATEMDFWRRSAGISRRDRITNQRVREIMNITHTMTDDARTKQLIWYGHVQRMGEYRLPKQLLRWAPAGRRRRGRPRRSWREGIDNEMNERGLEENQWLDREGWRIGIGKRRRTL